jgi:hypothetical protein
MSVPANEQEMIRIAATVKPGDTLVVTFDHRLDDQTAHELLSRWSDMVPGVKLVILPEVSDMAVITGEV